MSNIVGEEILKMYTDLQESDRADQPDLEDFQVLSGIYRIGVGKLGLAQNDRSLTADFYTETGHAVQVIVPNVTDETLVHEGMPVEFYIQKDNHRGQIDSSILILDEEGVLAYHKWENGMKPYEYDRRYGLGLSSLPQDMLSELNAMMCVVYSPQVEEYPYRHKSPSEKLRIKLKELEENLEGLYPLQESDNGVADIYKFLTYGRDNEVEDRIDIHFLKEGLEIELQERWTDSEKFLFANRGGFEIVREFEDEDGYQCKVTLRMINGIVVYLDRRATRFKEERPWSTYSIKNRSKLAPEVMQDAVFELEKAVVAITSGEQNLDFRITENQVQ